METAKKISSQLSLWIFIWFLLMGLALAGFGYWQMGILNESLQGGISPETLGAMLQNSGILFLQALGGSLVFFGILLWLTLRASTRRTLAKMDVLKSVTPAPKKVKKNLPPRPTLEEEEALDRENQRRTLHLLSLLQREGRLVDFLEENLKDYDDAQIGAAVRSIQENCQKTLKKYLKIEAVIDREEDEEIAVEKGFDASAIKLTGNVSGEPPFKGTLQHRGWRVGQFDLPTLSGSPDPAVIAPAEVEIP
ncbi:MAG: DUF2760 domain-containing protein [Deltaproteobacteria bacterium]|nr:DUF2760 domain-containing protein [Deltaproteobacteria bacterium]